MSIQSYIREIGRGKDGAKALSRLQASELMGMILDGHVNDLQLGAFCLAMRIKGETEQEMSGFLDAVQARLNYLSSPESDKPVIVIPSYNGARRLPVLTPLLGLLLAREGFAVLIHGSTTENSRISSQEVLRELGVLPAAFACDLKASELVFVKTDLISPGLQKLLDIRRTVGLRNSAHSMVKLIQPVRPTENLNHPKPMLITSYTHPEYAVSMRKTLELTFGNALLLRGCEGEPVADLRRAPAYTVIRDGLIQFEREAQKGSIPSSEIFSDELNAKTIAAYTKKILDESLPTPKSILEQIELIKISCLKK